MSCARRSERRKFFQPLYEFGQTFLASAGLSNESVKYYASLVQFYTVYKLQRMAVPTARLYLLCFAYHRFRQINDNLVDAFIHLVDQYEQASQTRGRDSCRESHDRSERQPERGRSGPEPVSRSIDSGQDSILHGQAEGILFARTRTLCSGFRVYAQHRVRQDRV